MQVKIVNKRMLKETDKSYVYMTGGNGNASFFSIPKSQIKQKNDSFLRINDVYKEPSTTYVLTDFIANKLHDDYLSVMSKYDVIITQ